ALVRRGAAAEAAALLAAALARCAAGEDGWAVPELLRLQGEAGFALEADAGAAAGLFRRGLALARRQGAVAWELRLALALARLPGGDARDLVAPVLARFALGAETADMRAARALLGAAAEDQGPARTAPGPAGPEA
ncbi:hypothetical protein, partial [Paracraurococcus ruber]|uniref:hypothetical protein n=1 Tax=Paracraurococcus ruber TaxID=77675 RepID=UPI00195F2495